MRPIAPRRIELIQSLSRNLFSREVDTSNPNVYYVSEFIDHCYEHDLIGSDNEYVVCVLIGLLSQCYDEHVDIDELFEEHRETYEPDSVMEFPVSPQSGEVSSQTVKFQDNLSAYVNSVNSVYDDVRESGTQTDVPLGDFLSRPVKIKEIAWEIDSPWTNLILPWSDYFTNPYIANRLNGYRLLQAKLHLKFVINGTPFHYGRLIASYYPMAGHDYSIPSTVSSDAQLILMSQRMHIYLNPADNDGGEMILPFTWWENALSTTVGDPTTQLDEMGALVITPVNLLKHANGGTDKVYISIFAWAEDVKMAAPTGRNMSGITPQAKERKDEYTGPISKPASAIANFASKLTKVPYIGQYATATQIGMQAAGKIASLFGFSRPTMLESSQFRPVPKMNMAVTNLPDDTTKLSLDAKQELTISTTPFGVEDGDSLDILRIAQVESYLAQIPVSSTDISETKLFECLVDPCLSMRDSFNAIHMTSMCFASLPFKYWRGSIDFRFQVVCSKFHRGRIKVVFDPWGYQWYNGGGEGTVSNPTYETAYTTIVDISENTDFVVKCGWGQSRSYRERMPLDLMVPYEMGNNEFWQDTDVNTFSNGTIAVYVVNDISCPGEANTDISINVFVKAGDDFEVAVPHGEDITRLRLCSTSVQPQSLEISPESDEGPDTSNTAEVQADNPEVDAVLDSDAAVIPITDAANLVHFGESVRSLRQILKRYCQHEIINIPNLTSTRLTYLFQRSALPFAPGYTGQTGSSIITSVDTGGQPYNYVYGYMTPLKYVSTAFLGWRGGIRYILDFGDFPCCMLSSVKAGRYSSCEPENLVYGITDGNQGLRYQYERNKQETGVEGITVQDPGMNRLISFEIPFYSNVRFIPGKAADYFGGGALSVPQLPEPCWKLGFNYTNWNPTNESPPDNRGTVNTYVSAAEDFNVAWYQGPPPMFLETQYPD